MRKVLSDDGLSFVPCPKDAVRVVLDVVGAAQEVRNQSARDAFHREGCGSSLVGMSLDRLVRAVDALNKAIGRLDVQSRTVSWGELARTGPVPVRIRGTGFDLVATHAVAEGDSVRVTLRELPGDLLVDRKEKVDILTLSRTSMRVAEFVGQAAYFLASYRTVPEE